MVEKVLNPGIVGIAGGRLAIFPAGIFTQQSAAPVTVIEGRVGDHEIRFQVFVGVVQKRALVVPPHLGAIDAADG